MKIKILFVDDEPRILTGLRRAFYKKNDEWEMLFAHGGEEALELLKKENVRIIVSDMRMPKMDGATLLKTVSLLYPDTLRIVLSGQTDLEMTMRTISVAHQFLAKPCEPQVLEEIIDRTCRLQDILKQKDLIRLINQIDKLPTLPTTYQKLIRALENPKASIEEITTIVEQDIAISAKLIQLANSAFFGAPKQTTSIGQAVHYIGLNTLKTLTLAVEGLASFENEEASSHKKIKKLQDQALACANAARSFFEDKHRADDAFLAGMFHDIGKLLLMTHLPQKYKKIIHTAQENELDLCHVEKEELGTSHAEIGGYLLNLWGIPAPVVEAVTYHHDPRKIQHKEFDVSSAVYLANLLVHKDQYSDKVDERYLENNGVSQLLPKWRELTKTFSNGENLWLV